MRDKISTVLTTAAMYMRLKNRAQAVKVFNHFVTIVESEGGCDTPEVVSVMEDFVHQYAKFGYIEQSEKLALMVRSLKSGAPGRFAPDGRVLEEWEQPGFGSSLPSLPYSINASRAQPGPPGLFGTTCVGIFVGGGVIWLSLQRPLDALHLNGLVTILYLCSVPLGGFLACFVNDQKQQQRAAQSWCRVHDDGIELSEPGKHCTLRWNEVRDVFRSWESGFSEDETYPVAHIQGPGNQKILIRARFFRDDEVETLYRICKLKHESR